MVEFSSDCEERQRDICTKTQRYMLVEKLLHGGDHAYNFALPALVELLVRAAISKQAMEEI